MSKGQEYILKLGSQNVMFAGVGELQLDHPLVLVLLGTAYVLNLMLHHCFPVVN